MSKYFSDGRADAALPILPVEKERMEEFLSSRPRMQAWAKAVGFEPEFGKVLPVPGPDGELAEVLLCLGGEHELWAFASAAQSLPRGDYRVEAEPGRDRDAWAALGWALGAYAFDRYKSEPAKPGPRLVVPSGADRVQAERTAEAIFMVRDMINTPAEEMGPAELACAALKIFRDRGGRGRVLEGDELLERNFPAIHRVGRGSLRRPRLIDLHWGPDEAPKVTLVGKGVCFDSGGLDLKSAQGMRDMKDDMGGAAHALGLARMIMEAGLEVRLRVLIPAVENMPSGNSYRPGDIIKTRQGIQVEISNTDAEGRVILSDALTEGASEKPEIMIDFATLTGAARVALGPHLPAVFSNREDLARDLVGIGEKIGDPAWVMPLYKPYRKMLDSVAADIRNANTDSPAGGAITAALFLAEFVGEEAPWIHLDIPGFSDKPGPGRPREADAFGLRSCFELIRERFGEKSGRRK